MSESPPGPISRAVLLTARLDAVLADFDSARVLSDAPSRLTKARHCAPPEPPALQTTYYIAPELMRAANGWRHGARDATPAADMFAFGMLLTRMAWPTKSMRRIMSSSRAFLSSTDTDGNGPGPLLPGSAAMPTDIAELVADCVAASPLTRPDARHVHARISNVRLIVAPAEPPPSEVDQGTGFELARGRAAHAAKCEPW